MSHACPASEIVMDNATWAFFAVATVVLFIMHFELCM